MRIYFRSSEDTEEPGIAFCSQYKSALLPQWVWQIRYRWLVRYHWNIDYWYQILPGESIVVLILSIQYRTTSLIETPSVHAGWICEVNPNYYWSLPSSCWLKWIITYTEIVLKLLRNFISFSQLYYHYDNTTLESTNYLSTTEWSNLAISESGNIS